MRALERLRDPTEIGSDEEYFNPNRTVTSFHNHNDDNSEESDSTEDEETVNRPTLSKLSSNDNEATVEKHPPVTELSSTDDDNEHMSRRCD